MSTVTVHSKKRVFDGFFKIDEIKFTISRFGGGALEQTRLLFERGDSAAALLHNIDTDELIFTEQFRYATYEKGPASTDTGKGWILELPAGSLDEGELPEETVRRELIEETGFEAGKVEYIGSFYVSPGGTSERIFCFYAPIRTRDLKNAAARGRDDESEDIARRAIKRADAFAMLDDARFIDAKTIIALQWLRLRKPG